MTSLAIPNAAAAAIDPTRVVSNALYRRLLEPSILPCFFILFYFIKKKVKVDRKCVDHHTLPKPKRTRASTVKPMLMYNAVKASCSKK